MADIDSLKDFSTQELLRDWEAAYRESGHSPHWVDLLAQQDSDDAELTL